MSEHKKMRLLSEKQLIGKDGKIGVSRQTLHRWRRKKNFPRPFKVAGGEKNLYDEAEVDVWLSDNIERA